MRIITVIFAAAALAMAACDKENPGPSPEGAELSFSIGGMETKASVAGTNAESTMQTLDVYVFFNDSGLGAANGQLETYRRYTPGSTTFSISGKDAIKISLGAKTVVFVANAPSDMVAGIKKKSDYDNWSAHSWTFAQNATDKFTMSLMKELTVTGDVRLDSSADPSLMLRRQVSRVELKGFKNDLPSALGKLTLEGAYLYNVNKSIDNSTGSDDNYWRKKDVATALGETAIEKLVNPGAYLPASAKCTGSLSKGASWTEKDDYKYFMYGFPNPASEAADASGKDWVTKLVIQTKVNGIRYYYPIGIKGMEANKTYVVNNVTVSRLGSTSPDKYVSTAALSISITVRDWDTGTITGNYNGILEGNDAQGWTINL